MARSGRLQEASQLVRFKINAQLETEVLHGTMIPIPKSANCRVPADANSDVSSVRQVERTISGGEE
jgi:hypothetical protein